MDEFLEKAQKARKEGNPEVANVYLKEALDKMELINNQELAKVYNLLAQIARDQGNSEEAIRWYEKRLAIHETQGKPLRQAHAIRHIADIQYEQDELDKSEENYKKALEIYRSTKGHSKLDLANALRGYALLLEARNHKVLADQQWREAKNLYWELGIEAGVQECMLHLNSLT